MDSKQDYALKLSDPRWSAKRSMILARDGFCCRLCKGGNRRLEVHHVRYTGEPWEAPDEDLITLCSRCHEYAGGYRDMVSIPHEFWLMMDRWRNTDPHGFDGAVDGFCRDIKAAGLTERLSGAANSPEAANL